MTNFSTYTLRIVGARGSTGTESLTDAVRACAEQTGIAFEDLHTEQNGSDWVVIHCEAKVAIITVV